jgi:hypothetical protein
MTFKVEVQENLFRIPRKNRLISQAIQGTRCKAYQNCFAANN